MFIMHSNKKSIKGLIALNSKATGFVTAAGFAEDIQIDSQYLNTALHGDEVEVSLFPKTGAERLTGEVIRVLHRAKLEFVGTVDKPARNGPAYIIPDDTKMYVDIFLPSNQAIKLQSGLKVQVGIKKWLDPKKNPEGVLIKVIGRKGNNNVEMESIVLEKGFQTSFPSRVESDAKRVKASSEKEIEKEIVNRRDFRNITTFTIDPEDAKDFDDAISFKKLEGKNGKELFEIGIHIADASHYVKEGGELDKEARHRGTSIYLVDRTIPMLPEILSNDLCSLNPNKDKLTFSAVLTMDEKGAIENVWLGRTIINSNKRFTYEEAQDVLDKKKGLYHDELSHLNRLAKIFRGDRMTRGSIDFEKDEVKFKLDSKGKPISVIRKERLDVHKLVEEFMILANIAVATYLSKEIKRINRGVSIYRVHGLPKKEAIDELLFLLRALGHDIEMKGNKDGQGISSKELNKILEDIRNKPEESLIKTVALRSMAKAIYSTTNIGHYGLALENYTHFTSPIRRYADVLVHRILDKHLKGKSLTNNDIALYHDIAVKLTEREIDAAEAERSSIAYKQVEYMLERVGNVYSGVVSGITKWGLYIEEDETKANGMIKFKDMTDDFYTFERESFSVVGNETKKRYSVGDKVKIEVVGGDLGAKTLDFKFAE